MLALDRLALTLALALSLAYAQSAAAATFRVQGIRGEVLFERTTSTAHETLGSLTDQLLREAVAQNQLHAYLGSNQGVTSINDLGSALEVLSDTEMNAFGWCYQIDGDTSDRLAHEYALTGKEQAIEWYYAYAHLNRNEWTAMCVPADHRPQAIGESGRQFTH